MIGGSNKLLSTREAAIYMGVRYRTLQSRYRIWGIPHHRVGRAVLFRVRDLDKWLDERRETAHDGR